MGSKKQNKRTDKRKKTPTYRERTDGCQRGGRVGDWVGGRGGQSSSWGRRAQPGACGHRYWDRVVWLWGTDGGGTCSEHGLVQSLCCAPVTNVTPCGNCASLKQTMPSVRPRLPSSPAPGDPRLCSLLQPSRTGQVCGTRGRFPQHQAIVSLGVPNGHNLLTPWPAEQESLSPHEGMR